MLLASSFENAVVAESDFEGGSGCAPVAVLGLVMPLEGVVPLAPVPAAVPGPVVVFALSVVVGPDGMLVTVVVVDPVGVFVAVVVVEPVVAFAVLAPTLVVWPLIELFALSVVLGPDASPGVVVCALNVVVAPGCSLAALGAGSVLAPIEALVLGSVSLLVSIDVLVVDAVSLLVFVAALVLGVVSLLAPMDVLPPLIFAVVGSLGLLLVSPGAAASLMSSAASGSEPVPMSGLVSDGVVARP